MKSWLQDAKNLQKELTENRRWLHEHAEVGFQLKKTATFVKEKLEEMGYTVSGCGKAGLIAVAGSEVKGKTFLLRADMDGLPIQEKTGAPYACPTGNMHACGHDLHTTMLLGAARLLKNHEGELRGRVKLFFQPAEETLQGAKTAISKGLLRDPKVDGAMMLHVMTGVDMPTGSVVVASGGVSAPAADYFTIEVKGKSCHGAAPQNGVDALTAAAYILIALQELSAREISASQVAALTVGKMQGGTAGNAIADRAVLEGTMRAFDEPLRTFLKQRMKEISLAQAKAFRAKAKLTFESGCPTLVNDAKLSALTEETAIELFGKNRVFNSTMLGGNTKNTSGGSEDFSYISHEVPSVMAALVAGAKKDGYTYPLHHPRVEFDENALPIGAALYAAVAAKFLKNNI
ncbi:MAG: amidohydrolase [Clostridiales bacterium]|nr:amidohydrolase [Clostridiales bacterium]